MGIFNWGSDASDNHERNKQAYEQVYEKNPEEHEATLSHELVAGGAAFFAMHEYEKKQEAEGHKVNHKFAKELLTGIAAGEVDRLAETKGLDFLDRQKTKLHARKEAESMYDQQYGNLPEGGNYY